MKKHLGYFDFVELQKEYEEKYTDLAKKALKENGVAAIAKNMSRVHGAFFDWWGINNNLAVSIEEAFAQFAQSGHFKRLIEAIKENRVSIDEAKEYIRIGFDKPSAYKKSVWNKAKAIMDTLCRMGVVYKQVVRGGGHYWTSKAFEEACDAAGVDEYDYLAALYMDRAVLKTFAMKRYPEATINAA